jgi:hypothetical protein
VATEGVARTVEKWGPEATSAGFTVLPNHLLAINQFVPKDAQLSPTEMLVLLQIVASWWSADRLPFPSKATIATRSGLSPRQVQRALSALETKGVINRRARFGVNRARSSNEYDLTGLVESVRKAATAHPTAFRRRARVEP